MFLGEGTGGGAGEAEEEEDVEESVDAVSDASSDFSLLFPLSALGASLPGDGVGVGEVITGFAGSTETSYGSLMR